MFDDVLITLVISIALMLILSAVVNYLLKRNHTLHHQLLNARTRSARLESKLLFYIQENKEFKHQNKMLTEYLDDAVESVYKREQEMEEKFRNGYNAGLEDAKVNPDDTTVDDDES